MDSGKWSERYSVDCDLKYQSEATRDNYKSCVTQFLYYFKDQEQPKSISTELIKNWLLTFETINTRNHKLCAVKSFYEITVGMPLKLDKIPFARKDKKLPQIIEEEEIKSILKTCSNLKHKTIICILYGCGLRISEVINLKIENINYNTIDIICAKGRKDRIVPMPKLLKDLIEFYIAEYEPQEFLFNGQFPEKELRYNERSINEFLKKYAKLAGITKNIHAHLFRHSYATHSLEQGTSLPFLQEILGHNNPKTTQIYLHTSRKSIGLVNSPLENVL